MTRTHHQKTKIAIATALLAAAIATPSGQASTYSNAGPTSGPTIGQLLQLDGPRAAGPTALQLGLISMDGPRAAGPVAPDLGAYSHDGPRSGPATELPAFSVDGPRSGPASNLPAFSIDGPRTAPYALPLTQPAPASRGIDWRTTGIGSAVGFAVGLLVAAAALLARRGRRTPIGV